MILENWLLSIQPASQGPVDPTARFLWTAGINTFGQIGDNTIVNKSAFTKIGTHSWREISAGASHTIALRSDNILFGWGDNSAGQLGDGTYIRRSSPVQIGSSSWIAISSKDQHTLAIDFNNKLFGWGNNTDGQLGLNNTYAQFDSWTQVSIGGAAAGGIKYDSTLWVWGSNAFGMGDGTSIAKSSPVQVGTSSWIAVGVGDQNAAWVALRTDGRLFAWGLLTNGQAGNNTASTAAAPVQVNATTSWSSFHTDGNTVAAIRSDGMLFVWGRNAYGHTAENGLTNSRSSPVQVGTSSWSFVRVSSSAVAAIDIQNRLFMWGENHGSAPLIAQKPSHNDYNTRRVSIIAAVGQSSWTSVSTGWSHTVAIRSDGTLWAWGANQVGQLGQNYISAVMASPIQIGTSSWVNVSVGSQALSNSPGVTLGIRNDGALFAWGIGFVGQIGDGTNITRSSPVQIGTSSWASISAGINHAAAIDAVGRLFTWGLNTSGQLGQNNVVTRSSPVQVGTSSWLAVAAGNSYTAAIRADNTLWVWGSNSVGQLGDGTIINRSSPVQVGALSWTQISAGGLNNTMGIDSNNKLYGWGQNTAGQLGDNTIINRSSPVQIGTSSWIAIGAGYTTCTAVKSDGTLWVWGDSNSVCIDSMGSSAGRSSPVQVGIETNWSKTSSGLSHHSAIKSTGALYVGGAMGAVNVYGGAFPYLGLDVNTRSPIQIGGSWSQIYIGDSHVVGLKTDGTLWDWGNSGTLGFWTRRYSSADMSSPIQIGTDYSWSAIATSGGDGSSSGGSTAAVIRSDGMLFTFGAGADGMAGNDTVNARKSMLTQVGYSSWISVAAGPRHFLAIRKDGALFSWGANITGALGQNTNINRSSPVQVGTSSWSMVAAGGRGDSTFYSLAIDTIGRLFGWGYNNASGSTQYRSSPVQIGTSSFTIVSAGLSHALAISTAGVLHVWGNVGNGGAGNGSATLNTTTPLALTSHGRSYIACSAGSDHSLAISTDNKLWVWGRNDYGQLGLNDISNKSSPVQLGSSNWSVVNAMGNLASQAITVDGTLFTWGLGAFAFGQLGLNDTINRSSPVQIGTSNNWTQAASIFATNFNINSDGQLWVRGKNDNGQCALAEDQWTPRQFIKGSWSQISGGTSHMNAIASDGAFFVWGDGANGKLMLNSITSFDSPTQVTLLPSSVVSIGTDFRSSGISSVILSDGSLWHAGQPQSGALGDIINTINKSSPFQIGTFLIHTPKTVGTSSWTTVSTGNRYTAAIRSDGALFTWGYNQSYQLGLGDKTNRSSPVQIGSSSWSSVDCGTTHTNAIDANGLLYGWGVNSNYATGTGITWSTFAPNESVSAGGPSFGIRTDGALIGWGTNTDGGIGIGNVISPVSTPTQIGLSSWLSVSSGYRSGFAIRSDNTLWSWGASTSGQLGLNDLVSRSSPVQIGTSSWIFVRAAGSGGAGNVSAIRNDGALFVWGFNNNGQVGDSTVINRSSPVQIGTSSWIFVSGGPSKAAIRQDGGLFTWGLNTSGQLGLNDLVQRSSPVQIGTSSWASVGVGGTHMAAIDSTGRLFTWGLNTSGQLGQNNLVSRSSPVQIGTSSWSVVACTGQGVAVIRVDGTLWSWGTTSQGGMTTETRSSPVQVGTDNDWTDILPISQGPGYYIKKSNGLWWQGGGGGESSTVDMDPIYNSTTIPAIGPVFQRGTNLLTPVQVGTSSWTKVSSGTSHGLAINSANNMFGWGSFAGGTNGARYSWSQIAAGAECTFGILSNKTLWAWGSSSSSQLGGPGQTSFPTQIGTSSWVMVDASVSHAAAIRSDGTLWAWGTNTAGRLGTNNTTNFASPVLVSASSWSTVATGFTHTVAIRSDGTLWAWGDNTSGQLGQNDRVSRSSPVQVGTSSWLAVTAARFGSHTVAIRADNTLWSWGGNASGELGQNIASNVARSSPVQIGTGSWKFVSSGYNCTYAIDINDQLWTFGRNSHGQLGLNISTSINRSSPVQVGTSSWIMVTGGTGFAQVSGTTIGILSTGALFTWGIQEGGAALNNSAVGNLSSPVQIGTSSWSMVASGLYGHNMAIRIDGTLWGGGRNNTGAVGEGTTVGLSSPTQVGSLIVPNIYNSVPTQVASGEWTDVSSGNNISMAISNTNILYGWGLNNKGAFGIVQDDFYASPVQINTDVIHASIGQSHTAIIKS